MSEIIFLGVLALIVIGPKELPELARTLGRFLNELKRTTNVLSDDLKQQAGLDKLSKLDYFEDRDKQDHTSQNHDQRNGHSTHVEEQPPQENPDQLELTAQAQEDTEKGAKKS